MKKITNEWLFIAKACFPFSAFFCFAHSLFGLHVEGWADEEAVAAIFLHPWSGAVSSRRLDSPAAASSRFLLAPSLLRVAALFLTCPSTSVANSVTSLMRIRDADDEPV